jgi:AI-2 transport protein TqsA
MKNESSNSNINSSAVFYSLGSIALAIAGLLYFANIIKPFVFAILVWFIIIQLRDAIGKITIKGRALPAWIRTILSCLIIFILGYLIAELVIRNLIDMAASMPEYIANLDKYFEEIRSIINNPKYAERFQNWFTGIDFAGKATALVNSLSGMLSNLAVVVIYVIFFLMEEASRKLKFEALFPEKGKKYDIFVKNLDKVSLATRSYLWQKTLISLITGIVSYAILLLMGVDYAFLWSFLIFILNFIPYIGPLLSSLFPAIFAVLATGNFMQFVYVFAAMEGVQIVLGNFIEPKMMGKGTNLGPVTVILALAFWGMIWGLAGMILALPITSILVIMLSQIPSTRYLAIILSERGEIMEVEE